MQFPEYRPRRLRRTVGLRRMVKETRLDPANFVYPLFVVEGQCWGISQDLQHPLRAGDLFIAPVGHGAWIQLTEGSCKAVWFHTADSDLWQALKSGPVTVQRALDPTGMASVMTLLLREQAGGPSVYCQRNFKVEAAKFPSRLRR